MSSTRPLPQATDIKGTRQGPSAVTGQTLPEGLQPLTAPPPLALPDQLEQVRIHQLRPLTLEEVLQLAEVNSPTLKAAASQVDQAQSALRAAIASWYPTVDLSANGLPQYLKSYASAIRISPARPSCGDGPFGQVVRPERTVDGQNEFYSAVACRLQRQRQLGHHRSIPRSEIAARATSLSSPAMPI